MNLFKSFNSGLGQYMRKAAHPSGSVESSNPCRWRGKRLHHHGGDVCCVIVLLWMDSWHHKLNVCKKLYKNNPKMRLTALLSAPHWHAPCQELKWDLSTLLYVYTNTLSAYARPPWISPSLGKNMPIPSSETLALSLQFMNHAFTLEQSTATTLFSNARLMILQ